MRLCNNCLYFRNNCGIYRIRGLDDDSIEAYRYLHHCHRDRRPGPAQTQDPTPRAAGCPEPASGAGPRAVVPGRWLLRCPRSGPGEVRDAAPSEHRGRKQGRGRRPLWPLATHPLPSRSGVREARALRAAAAAARPEEPPQAHARGDGVHRGAGQRRARCGRAHARPGDPHRARPVRSSPQYRARAHSEKKTVTIPAPSPLTASVALYEQLRAEVLRGQARPEGLGAIVYHGLIDGVKLLSSSAALDEASAPCTSPALPAVRDRALLRLLANMVLQTQSEVMHVY